MRKLVPYIKPFLGVVLLAAALLFVQAMCDLNLPNYMSKIVNVGIQQYGLQYESPEALSREAFDLMGAFMVSSDRARVEEHYALRSGVESLPSGEAVQSRYKKAAAEDIYVLRPVTEEQREDLNRAFRLATWTMIYFIQGSNGGDGEEPTEALGQMEPMDLSAVAALLPLLQTLPEEALGPYRQRAAGTDEMLLTQSGIMAARTMMQDAGADMSSIQRQYIVSIGLIMLLITALGGLATVAVSLLSSRIAAGVARDLRGDVFSKVSRFSSEEFDRFSTASLITRSTNDITQIQHFLMLGIRMVCYAPMMLIGGVIMAVNKAASIAWIIAVACVLLVGMMLIIFSIAMPKFKLVQQQIDRLNLVAREHLGGLLVIRAFGRSRFEKKRFAGVNEELTKTNLFINRAMVTMMPMMMLIMNGVSVLLLWVGSHRIAESAMQVGDMMAFLQYAMQILMSFLMISMMFIFVPRASVSAERIAEVLGTEPAIQDPSAPERIDAAKRGEVTFDRVSFRYRGAEEDVLKNVSFTASPGKMTAIIGSTGSGKSTLVQLILRFYDVSAGRVLVGGRDVRELSQGDLRGGIGYVPQRGVLFTGTIEENLRYGDEKATEQALIDAIETAQATSFVMDKPEGIKAPIAQGGANVSGGQKQRLSMARALVGNPDVLIFDDSFSALDYQTDAALRTALKEKTEQSTVIVVAQRVSTIRSADQILVLDQGEVVGVGIHEQLLETCQAYKEIASSQFGEEEGA